MGGKRPVGAAIFDLDGTLISGDSLRLYFLFLWRTGALGLSGVAVVALAGVLRKLRLISLSTAKSMCAGTLKGMTTTTLNKLAEEFVVRYIEPRISSHARNCLQEHKSNNRVLILATSSPNLYVGKVADALGIENVVATEIETVQGRLTGKLSGHDAFGEVKLEHITTLCGELGIELAESYAYSDHHSDLPLLHAVGFPCAVSPTARLKQHAESHNWQIVEWHSVTSA